MAIPDIVTATRSYERWMASLIPVVRADLIYKHQRMEADLFTFLRATFYRWAQVWPDVCADLATAPAVLAVGDAHLENFGTWRDAEGRLVWGINDFDEAHTLPYTIDLSRLATSAVIGSHSNHIALSARRACEAILDGYLECLQARGRPLVLEQHDAWLRKTALTAVPDPVRFWNKMDMLPAVRRKAPESARRALEATMVEPIPYRLVGRRAGTGSLGRQRMVALGDWRGAMVAREAKSFLPSAWGWAHPGSGHDREAYMRTVRAAIRCPDPFLRATPDWVVRRLAPDCARIELTMLPRKRDDYGLLRAMGWETANIHLGSLIAPDPVLADLEARPAGWLRDSTRRMLHTVQQDWKQWRAARATSAPQPG
jgi:hypothetical protein